MKKTNKIGAFVAGAAVLAASCGLAEAQITFASGGSLTAWNGTPVYTSLAGGGLSGLAAQGDPTSPGTFGLMAETFTPGSTFTLGSFAMMLGVNNVTSPTYIVNLYNLGPAGTVSVSSSSASYNPYTASPASISLTFSDTVTFSGGSGGEVQGTFTLPSADQVSLIAGEEYALEILTPTNNGASGVTWYRGTTADPGGQMFSGGDGLNSNGGGVRNTLAGNGQAGAAPRTGALALYSVPEPGTLAIMGVGGFLSMLALRRRKS